MFHKLAAEGRPTDLNIIIYTIFIFCQVYLSTAIAFSTTSTPEMFSARVFSRQLIIKRDDILVHGSSEHHLTGNKQRKLDFIISQASPYRHSKYLISCGGLQSNSMFALAKISSTTGGKFLYFVKENHTGNQHLCENPVGNLAQSLQLGMKVRWMLQLST